MAIIQPHCWPAAVFETWTISWILSSIKDGLVSVAHLLVSVIVLLSPETTPQVDANASGGNDPALSNRVRAHIFQQEKVHQQGLDYPSISLFHRSHSLHLIRPSGPAWRQSLQLRTERNELSSAVLRMRVTTQLKKKWQKPNADVQADVLNSL